LAARPTTWWTARRAGYTLRHLVRLTLWRDSLRALNVTDIVHSEAEAWLPRLAFGRRGVQDSSHVSFDQAECVAVIISQDRRDKLLLAISLIREHLCQSVVVVDGGSSDDSASAAREAGAVVIHRRFDRNFAAQRNFGVRYASRELGAKWIFRVDDDEQVSEALGSMVKGLIARAGRADAIYVPVVNYGPELWDLDVHFVPVAHRAICRWRGEVHERLSCQRPLFTPHTGPPLVNQKSIEEVWRAILLYEAIRPGTYDAGVVLGCRQALDEFERRMAQPDPDHR
jgi:hypothetical protein